MAPNILYGIVAAVFTLVIGYDIYNWLKKTPPAGFEMKSDRVRTTVNSSVFILSLTLVLVSISFHVNIFRYNRPKVYSEFNTITLKDFKGFRLPNETLDGIHEFAFITTSVEWTRKGNAVEVKCLFHPSRSYVYNENIVDAFLLRHELYHFHIAEWSARQSRKELDVFKEMPSRKVIESILSASDAKEWRMQAEYDDKTYHGYILKEQKKWQQKVDSLLISSQNYSNVKITYN